MPSYQPNAMSWIRKLVLVGENVILRPPRMADASPLFEHYFSDALCLRYLVRKSHVSFDQTTMLLEKLTKPFVEDREAFSGFSIECPKTKQLLGLVTCTPSADGVHIQYGIRRDRWGQGLATESVLMASAALMEVVDRVYTVCPSANLPSIRVLKKAGFQATALMPKALILPAIGRERQDGIRFEKWNDPPAFVR